jgi:alpha-L-fucosidase 2
MDIFNGEVSGKIVTDNDEIVWTALSDRENLVFVVKMETGPNESDAILGVREEWGISPRYYLDNKNPLDYASHLPPKPELGSEGDIDLVINKMKNKGAHVVASQLVEQTDGSRVIYVAIGTSDDNNTSVAATKARTDAVARVTAAVNQGYDVILARNQNWWNNYMLSSKLFLNEDYKWQKFWWLQMYKFACASSEASDLLIDTQGPWITETAWAGVWWNLNVQLSYFPIYSGNKLEAGRSLINGINRLYDSGVLHENAAGKGINVGRSSTYEGKATWGSEYGNLPWALHCYWKYWRYSGDDEIGRKLFTILSDNAEFLMTKLVLKGDGKYHMVESRSPEYSDSELYENANYGLMSAHWVFKTLLEMDQYFEINHAKKAVWQEYLDKLIPFPSNSNGFMVGANQGFDKGHRHYSHLLAIYPYHTVAPGTGQDELVEASVNRWLSLTMQSGHAGYTYTGGAAMLATLGDGNEALKVFDKLYIGKLQPNTMYSEGGGQVIETPLSGVESINYMLLQSWNGIIKVFPAVPDKWQNVAFEDFRTEGAFLVSAALKDGAFDHFDLFSEKGNTCTIQNPWPDKELVVKDGDGNKIETQRSGLNYTFSTEAGKEYRIETDKAPRTGDAKILNNPNEIILTFTENIKQLGSFSGFTVQINGIDNVDVLNVTNGNPANVLIVSLASDISKDDEVTISYQGGNVVSETDLPVDPFSDYYVENLLSGSPPRIVLADTDGLKIRLTVNKNLKAAHIESTDFTILRNATQEIEFSAFEWVPENPVEVFLVLNETVYAGDLITLDYSGNSLVSDDDGLLKNFSGLQITNNAPGRPLEIVSASVIDNGTSIKIAFDKDINPIGVRSTNFNLFINNKVVGIAGISVSGKSINLLIDNALWFDDVIELDYKGGNVKAYDNGILEDFVKLQISNNLTEPAYKNVPGKIQAEDYYLMKGIQLESTSDVGGGQNVGYIDNGDWLEYVLLVPETREYKLTCRVAANHSSAQLDFLVSDSDTRKITSLALPITGGWQKWVDVSTIVSLKEGRQRLRLLFVKGGCNLNWFSFGEDLYATTGLTLSNNGLVVFPNPTKGRITVQSTSESFDQICLYDLMGKQHFTTKLNQKTDQAELQLPTLASGNYILKVENNEKALYTKLFITNK